MVKPKFIKKLLIGITVPYDVFGDKPNEMVKGGWIERVGDGILTKEDLLACIHHSIDSILFLDGVGGLDIKMGKYIGAVLSDPKMEFPCPKCNSKKTHVSSNIEWDKYNNMRGTVYVACLNCQKKTTLGFDVKLDFYFIEDEDIADKDLVFYRGKTK
jgi:hypothetical protein